MLGGMLTGVERRNHPSLVGRLESVNNVECASLCFELLTD